MEDMIFHMFFVVPLTRWFTSPDRPWNKKSTRYGVYLAIMVLFLVGVIQSMREESNHFETLGLDSNVTPRLLSAAYRRLSLQYHPDKNSDPEAKEVFAKIKQAYETISSEKNRLAYDRFGDFSKTGEIDEEQFYDILFITFFQTMIPLIFGFLYTYGSDSAASRQIYSSYMGLVFSLDVLLRFSPTGGDILKFLPFVGNLCVFERIKLMQAWVPIVLNGLLLLGSEFYVDEREVVEDVTIHTLESSLDVIPYFDHYLAAIEGAIRRFGGMSVRRRWILSSQKQQIMESDGLELDHTNSVLGRQVHPDLEKTEHKKFNEKVVNFEVIRDIYAPNEESKGNKNDASSRTSKGNKKDASFQTMKHIENPQGRTTREKVVYLANLVVHSAEEDTALVEKMKAYGYVDVWESYKPWRLSLSEDNENDRMNTDTYNRKEITNDKSDKITLDESADLQKISQSMEVQPDLWKNALEKEMEMWPQDLNLSDVVPRKECTENGWCPSQKKYRKLLETIDAEDDDENGISLGTIIFFGMLLLKYYTGGSW